MYDPEGPDKSSDAFPRGDSQGSPAESASQAPAEPPAAAPQPQYPPYQTPPGVPQYAPGYPPPGYVLAPVQQTRTNGFAIASLVLGILWIYWIGSVLALVFGYIAKSQIDRSSGIQSGRGMAIAGIVLGWIGVGIFLLLIIVGIGVGVGGG
jgi:hypothetical protein